MIITEPTKHPHLISIKSNNSSSSPPLTLNQLIHSCTNRCTLLYIYIRTYIYKETNNNYPLLRVVTGMSVASAAAALLLRFTPAACCSG